MPFGRLIVAILIFVATILVPLLAQASDPDALRKIVEGHCVPSESAASNPARCRLVDLTGHYAVLKDLLG